MKARVNLEVSRNPQALAIDATLWLVCARADRSAVARSIRQRRIYAAGVSPAAAKPSAPHAAEPAPEPAWEGMEVLLQKHFGPLRLKMPVRVIYTINEPASKGFAFGTLKGHPVSGEAAFIVERDPDGSVWFTLRSLSGPRNGLWLLAYPLVLMLRTGIRSSYIKALSGPVN